MASNTRKELISEVMRLRKQHYEALAKATFGGFTVDEEATHVERAKCIASLIDQLETLEDTPPFKRPCVDPKAN